MSGSKTLNECFLEACKNMDAKKVESAINLGCDINCVDPKFKYSALMWSSGPYFNYEIMNLILQQPGIDVNYDRKNPVAGALHAACYYGNPAAMTLLSSVRGLNVNIQDTEGKTAAHYAVTKGHTDCLEVLAQIQGVDFNIKNNDGETVLLCAYSQGRKDLVKVLLAYPGVNVKTRDKEGMALIDLARKNEDAEILKLIPGTMEYQLEVLAQKVSSMEMKTSIPECPVCFNPISPPKRMFQCMDGHVVCGDCKPNIRICPTCRGAMGGRAHAFEQFLRERQ